MGVFGSISLLYDTILPTVCWGAAGVFLLGEKITKGARLLNAYCLCIKIEMGGNRVFS